MDILGSTFRHGLDWVTTLTHSIRRVVLFDPQHPGQDTQVLKVMIPDVPGNISLATTTGKTSTTTQDYTAASSVTQEPTTTRGNENNENLIISSDPLTEGFEPVAAFVKNDTLVIEPVNFPEEDDHILAGGIPDIPDLPTVKRERPQGNEKAFHIAVGAIGLSSVLTGVVLMSGFRERVHKSSILISRGVQTI